MKMSNPTMVMVVLHLDHSTGRFSLLFIRHIVQFNLEKCLSVDFHGKQHLVGFLTFFIKSLTLKICPSRSRKKNRAEAICKISPRNYVKRNENQICFRSNEIKIVLCELFRKFKKLFYSIWRSVRMYDYERCDYQTFKVNINWQDMENICSLFVSRGFGFITFKDANSVEKVLANDIHTLDEKQVGFVYLHISLTRSWRWRKMSRSPGFRRKKRHVRLAVRRR